MTSSNERPKVLLTVHSLKWVHKEVLRKVVAIAGDPRFRVSLDLPCYVPFENGLAHTVNLLMKGDWEWWLSIDADNPPMRNPLDLIELDRDIMGCPTPVYHYTGEQPGERPIYWNAYQFDAPTGLYREWPVKEGLQRVDAVGTGCILINRRVFEHPEMRKGPFMRRWNEDGTVERGNDIAFCERAREHGFEIWCHFDYPAEHMVEVPLNEISKAFKALM